LIDGLVPSWNQQDREVITHTLLGLVLAAQDLWREWNNRLEREGLKNGFSVILFIRTDIFRTLLSKAEEPDKLRYEQLSWEDTQTLLQVINRRIQASLGNGSEYKLNWSDLLEPGFRYDQMEKMLESSLLPRPRDVIYYFQRVLFHATRKNTKRITRRGFQDSWREYSEYALQALSAEWHPDVPDMTDLLLQFWGSRAELTAVHLREVLLKAGVPEERMQEVLRFLIESQFLGVSIDPHNYRFASTSIQADAMTRQAGRFVHDQGGERKFKVHRAFNESLGLYTKGARRR
ncbi:MAG: hypothetical protein V3V35_01520, partial [Dehalococcoidia bacterium]